MSVSESLQTRRLEREALLDRLLARIREDRRVVAAWLTGSLGRGDGDDLSDLDLWIAVADNYSRFIMTGWREFVQRLEAPLLIKEASQNAPQDGGYLLTLYSGTVGPHQVDWYWQPQSKTSLPPDAKVLFDLVGLPQVEAPEVSVEQRAAEVTDRVAFFWAMIGIAAKKAARGQSWTGLRMIEMVRNTLAEVRRVLGNSALSEDPQDLPPVTPEAQMGYLKSLAREMETLHPDILAIGGDSYQPAGEQIQQFFSLAEAMLREPENDGNSG